MRTIAKYNNFLSRLLFKEAKSLPKSVQWVYVYEPLEFLNNGGFYCSSNELPRLNTNKILWDFFLT